MAVVLTTVLYFHFFEKITFLTHFLYLPVILAGIWLGRRGLILTIGCALVYLGSHFFLMRPHEVITQDLFRTGMLIFVGALTAFLSERLISAERLYRKIADGFQIGVFVVQNGKIQYINETSARVTGLRRNELKGRTPESFVHPDDLSGMKEAAARMLKGEFSQPYEYRIIDREGRIHWIMEMMAPIQFGGRKAVLGNNLEVTDRKLTEESLRRSEEKYRNIVDSAMEGIAVHDKDFRVSFANGRYVEILGYSPDEIIGMPISSLVFPEDLADQQIKMQRRREGHYTRFERRLRNREGREVWCLISSKPIMDEQGRFRGSLDMLTDITELKKVEHALKESESRLKSTLEETRRQKELLQTVLDNIPVMIAFFNLSGNIHWINRHWEDRTGWSLEETRSRAILEEFYPDPEYRRHVIDFIRESSGRWGDFRSMTKDGSVLETSWANVQLRDGTNIGIGIDVTDRRRAEEEKRLMQKQLEQAQKLEAIGTLSGGIAHDFNNILASIIGYTEMEIMERSGNQGLQSGNLEQVLKAGIRGRELVRQILAFSRPTETERKPLHVGGVIQEIMNLLRATLPTTIEFQREIMTERDTVVASPAEIHQVLMNLCMNSAHAMRNGGGRLEVKLGNVLFSPGDSPAMTDLESGEYLLLTVSDTGHGIDPSIMDRIFDPFFTTTEQGEGTGLGLSVVYGIVQNLGGSVQVESSPGRGTEFLVYLPVVELPVESEPVQSGTAFPRGQERILFVDDEEEISEMGRSILSFLGYDVTATSSSLEALELFRGRPDAFDLVILDYTMPDMTGIDLAHKIYSLRRDLPVILCSGLSEVISLNTDNSNIVRKLAKPFRIGDIASAVRDTLDGEGT